MSTILKAAAFATDAHKLQKRKWSWRPYIEHPGRVVARVSTLPDGIEREVAAAWLHDVFEDQPDHKAVIYGNMPANVVNLVEELTNNKHHPGVSKSRKAADRMRLQHVGRWAKIIKLIDRQDNIRDMDGADSGFKSLYLHESLLLANVLFDYTDPLNKRFYLELMVEIAKQT